MTKSFDFIVARKELLMMKAELERRELSGDLYRAKAQLAWLPAVKKTFGVLTGRYLGSLGPLSALGGEAVDALMRKHPILGAITSAALFRYRGPIRTGLVRAGVGASLAAGAVYLASKSRNPTVQQVLHKETARHWE
jgi:hypothetical protein